MGRSAIGTAGPTPEDLETLMAATAVGCEQSFSRLYRLTSGRMLGIVKRFVRHPGQAEEVLQDLYGKVWFRSRQFDAAKGRALYWLASAATRAALDALRANRARPWEAAAAADDETAYDRFSSDDATPEDRYVSKERAVHLRRQIEGLPANSRECLLLAFFEDMSHRQISTSLGSPLGTVKSHIRRGLQSMRPALEAIH